MSSSYSKRCVDASIILISLLATMAVLVSAQQLQHNNVYAQIPGISPSPEEQRQLQSQQRPSQENTSTTTPFTTYKDPQGVFTIDYPRDWIAKAGNRFDKSLAQFDGPHSSFIIQEVTLSQNSPSNFGLRDNFELAMMGMARSSPNFESIEDIRCDKYIVDGNEACSTVFTRTANYPDMNKLAVMILSFQEGQKVYSFIYKALPDNFDSILPLAEKMIGSFKIVANTAQTSSS
jgi:hypothetical protein